MIWARIEMTGSREGFGNGKHLLQFPDHKATEKRKLKQKPQKNKGKRIPEMETVSLSQNIHTSSLSNQSRGRDFFKGVRFVTA